MTNFVKESSGANSEARVRRRALLFAILVAAAAPAALIGGCAGRSSGAPSSASPASSRAAAASPTPLDLRPPTTIRLGTSATTAATLSKATCRARLSASRALAGNSLRFVHACLTDTILADVSMPSDYYRGRPIRDLPCWVFVFTYRKPFQPVGFGFINSAPSPSPTAAMDWHMVFIVDASNGRFVRGFPTW